MRHRPYPSLNHSILKYRYIYWHYTLNMSLWQCFCYRYCWVHDLYYLYILNFPLDSLTLRWHDQWLMVGPKQTLNSHFWDFSGISRVRRDINNVSEKQSVTCNSMKGTNKGNNHRDNSSQLRRGNVFKVLLIVHPFWSVAWTNSHKIHT